MKALIIGYGSAGKRHAQHLTDLGVEWNFYDPMIEYDPVIDIGGVATVSKFDYDFAVICTPPQHHLNWVNNCRMLGFERVVCEKPMCGFGQSIPPWDGVTFTYNWRWYPEYQGLPSRVDKSKSFAIHSEQYRKFIPEWGLVLDHISHSIDLILWLYKYPTIHIEGATVRKKSVFVEGKIDEMKFSIYDHVSTTTQIPRTLWLKGSGIDLQPDLSFLNLNKMFLDMWQDILSWIEGDGPNPVPWGQALRVNQILEEINKVSK